MRTRLESAVASEVLAEVKRQRYTYTEIQERSGVKARAWGYYFREDGRAIPFDVLAAVCEALGVKASEMIARGEAALEAEDRAGPAADLSEHITRQLSPEAQAQVRAARAGVSKRSRQVQPNV